MPKAIFLSPPISYLVVFVVALLAFLPSLGHEFVWDDHSFILSEERVGDYGIGTIIAGSQPEYHTGVYRPVRNFFYVISYHLWGTEPWGYHLQAMFIHAALTVLLVSVLSKISGNHTASLVVGIVHALHPIHVQSVSWVTASFDLWGVLFGLLAFWFYLVSRQSGNSKRYWHYSLACLALGLFSYEMVLVVPGLILIHHSLEWWSKTKLDANSPINRQTYHQLRSALDRSKAFQLTVMVGIYFVIRTMFVSQLARMPILTINSWESLKLVISLTGRYLRLLLLPFDQAVNHYFFDQIPSLLYLDWGVDRPLPHINTLSYEFASYLGAHLLMVVLLVWGIRRRNTSLALGVFWLYLGLLPVSQLLPQPIIFSEYYAYLSSLGLGLVLVGIWQILRARLYQAVYLASVIVWVVVLSYQTFMYQSVWANDVVLWRHQLELNPTSASSLNSLGAALVSRGQTDEGIKYYYQAVAANNQVIVYQRNLVTSLVQAKRFDEAIGVYLNLINQYPQARHMYEQLAQLYLELNQPGEALGWYRQLYQLDPQPRLLMTIEELESLISSREN